MPHPIPPACHAALFFSIFFLIPPVYATRPFLSSQGNGFISSDRLPALISALPQYNLPPLEALRTQLDPERTSLIIWDRFQQTLLRFHPATASSHAEIDPPLEFGQTAIGDPAAGAIGDPAASAIAAAAHNPPAALALLHYNGLGAAGHAHKRALREVAVRPGAGRGHPSATGGLAAVVQTRWKDALVTWEGDEPPSIN